MRSILQYILEEVQIKGVFSKIRKQVSDGIEAIPDSGHDIIKDLKKRVGKHERFMYCQDKSSKHQSDIFKGAYGEDDERAYSILKRILDAGAELKTTYTNYSIGDYKVWGRSNGTSSLYKSWEVKFTLINGNAVTGYIMNTAAPAKRSRNQAKLFTPNKLLDLSDGKTYKNVNDIITELLNKFESMGEIDDGAASCMQKLIEVFNGKLNIISRTGAFESDSFADYLSAQSGTITVKIPDDTFTDVNDELKNIIANDFGEILDGLLFLKIYEDQEVSFPMSATEQAVDLNVITPGDEPVTTGISAKANGGSAASGSQLLAFYNNIKTDETTDDVAAAIEEFPDALTGPQRKLLTDLCENVWDKTMAYGQCWIIDTYFPAFPETDMNAVFERAVLCTDSKNQKKNIIETLIAAIKNPNKHKNLLNLYKHSWTTSKFKSTDQSNLDLDDMNSFIGKLQSLISKNPDGIYGLLIYPAYAYSVNNVLNSKSNQELLTAVCNKFLSYRQVYLSFGKDSITWTSKQAATAPWKFVCGNATTKPFEKKLCIKMIK